MGVDLMEPWEGGRKDSGWSVFRGFEETGWAEGRSSRL